MNGSTTKSANVATVTTPADREIRIEHVFHASRDRVWRAFTEVDLVAQWWGRGNQMVIERFEVERGGHWRFVEHAGGEAHGFEGRLREVTPQDRLVYTFEWDGMPGHVVNAGAPRGRPLHRAPRACRQAADAGTAENDR
jgi:uncharacterized protein YndB with AHSA1/START domain